MRAVAISHVSSPTLLQVTLRDRLDQCVAGKLSRDEEDDPDEEQAYKVERTASRRRSRASQIARP